MTFFVRTEEIATQEPDGATFVLAHYWRSRAAFQRGESPARRNDFLLGLPPAQMDVIATDPQGRLLTIGGAAVDLSDVIGIEHWRMVTVNIDRGTLIRREVDAYWQRAEVGGFPADHTAHETNLSGFPIEQIERSRRDPNGVLAETRAMVGEERLVR